MQEDIFIVALMQQQQQQQQNHATPKDSFIRNTSDSELKFHPVKVKMAFIFL